MYSCAPSACASAVSGANLRDTLRVAPHRKPLSVTRQQESPPKLFGKAGSVMHMCMHMYVHARASCYREPTLHIHCRRKAKKYHRPQVPQMMCECQSCLVLLKHLSPKAQGRRPRSRKVVSAVSLCMHMHMDMNMHITDWTLHAALQLSTRARHGSLSSCTRRLDELHKSSGQQFQGAGSSPRRSARHRG